MYPQESQKSLLNEEAKISDTETQGGDTAPTVREVAPETKAVEGAEPFVEEKRTILYC